MRSLLERYGDASAPSASEEGAYSPSYGALLRREIVILSGSWVLNFQPLVAAAIYRRFAPPSNAVVYDPCGGWGGRLLGAALAGNVASYVACEPSAASHAGLGQLSELLRVHAAAAAARGAPSHRMHVELLRRGAEVTELPPASVDLVFTSPPYFNLELYAHGEASQAHVKWVDARSRTGRR